MSSWDTEQLAADDKRFVWHPFTPMGEWCAPEHEPLVLVSGDGALVRDSRGREYIDGNASIWTNVHGHNHPRINAAIRAQLDRVAHTSFLGTTNPPAIELARRIVELFPREKFGRVFFSDDGSTAVEAALRIVSQYWQLNGSSRRIFVSFREGYHGDTVGAASLGASAMFGSGLGGWVAPTLVVSSPEELSNLANPTEIAAVVIEPVIQGAAGMKIWSPGTLKSVREWCDQAGTLLIADEVMTGFGRTGKMFACEHEGVEPDVYVFGKGLTGGYLPLALTLLTNEIFRPFESVKSEATLFYGHSYTGNALGCAAALASLETFASEGTLAALGPKIRKIQSGLAGIEGAVRTRGVGMIGALDLPNSVMAKEVCRRALGYGLLTRSIRETVVFMPPLCVSSELIEKSLSALQQSITNVLTETMTAREPVATNALSDG